VTSSGDHVLRPVDQGRRPLVFRVRKPSEAQPVGPQNGSPTGGSPAAGNGGTASGNSSNGNGKAKKDEEHQDNGRHVGWDKTRNDSAGSANDAGARGNAKGNAANGNAAKANPGDPAAMQQLGAAENVLTQTLGRLFALSEAYPDLKANQNMMQLTEELTSTENRDAFARQAFNDSVMGYNNRREEFPNNIVAGMFGFQQAALLEIEKPEQRAAVQVKFT
jgi:hypothetical protein